MNEIRTHVPKTVTVSREEGKPDYIQFEVEGRPIVEGYLVPTAPKLPVDTFRCQHCGGVVSTINTAHSAFFDDDGRYLHCATTDRVLRPYEGV